MWDILGYAGEGDGTPTKKQLIPETTIFNQTELSASQLRIIRYIWRGYLLQKTIKDMKNRPSYKKSDVIPESDL